MSLSEKGRINAEFTMKYKKKLLLSFIAILFISSGLVFSISASGEDPEASGIFFFPFTGAKAVYTVEGNSPLGHLIGTMTYTVKAVDETSYTVNITTEGNISKIPSLVKSDTRSLERNEPLSFSSVIEKSDLVSEKILRVGEREIKVNKYLMESEKEFGREKITIFIPDRVKVPLIITYRYSNRFDVTIELDKTNVEYLQ